MSPARQSWSMPRWVRAGGRAGGWAGGRAGRSMGSLLASLEAVCTVVCVLLAARRLYCPASGSSFCAAPAPATQHILRLSPALTCPALPAAGGAAGDADAG